MRNDRTGSNNSSLTNFNIRSYNTISTYPHIVFYDDFFPIITCTKDTSMIFRNIVISRDNLCSISNQSSITNFYTASRH